MLKIFALSLSLVLAAPAFAHETREPAVKIDFVAQDVPLADSDVQSLIHQSHEVIEGDESGNFLARWRKAFDFKTRIVDGLRWSASVNDPKYRNLAIDSLFLFGMSHGTEMLSGPILLGVGYAHEWPNWVMSTIASGGTLISIPGLDPLCMAVFAFYAKSSDFRGGVAWMRLAVVHSLGKVAHATGLKNYVAKVFARPNVREYLQSLEGLKSVIAGEDGTIDFKFELATASGESAMQIGIHFAEGKSYLEEVVLNKIALATMEAREIKNFSRQFGWNAHDFIKSAMREELLQKPYILEAKPGDYILAPNAIAVKAKRGCEDRLKSI
jgi:hypothetical protein